MTFGQMADLKVLANVVVGTFVPVNYATIVIFPFLGFFLSGVAPDLFMKNLAARLSSPARPRPTVTSVEERCRCGAFGWAPIPRFRIPSCG